MVQVGPAAGTPAGFSFVEWGSVIAGAITAAALSFVFLTFGSAIGLSAVSPWPNSGSLRENIGVARGLLDARAADRRIHDRRLYRWAHAHTLVRGKC